MTDLRVWKKTTELGARHMFKYLFKGPALAKELAETKEKLERASEERDKYQKDWRQCCFPTKSHVYLNTNEWLLGEANGFGTWEKVLGTAEPQRKFCLVKQAKTEEGSVEYITQEGFKLPRQAFKAIFKAPRDPDVFISDREPDNQSVPSTEQKVNEASTNKRHFS